MQLNLTHRNKPGHDNGTYLAHLAEGMSDRDLAKLAKGLPELNTRYLDGWKRMVRQ